MPTLELGAATVLRRDSGDLFVIEAESLSGPLTVRFPGGALCLFESEAHTIDRWESDRPRARTWRPGDVGFLPASSTLRSTSASPFRATFVSMSDPSQVDAVAAALEDPCPDQRCDRVTTPRLTGMLRAMHGMIASGEAGIWPFVMDGLCVETAAELSVAPVFLRISANRADPLRFCRRDHTMLIMMTPNSPAALPRRLLLVKAQGQFKHSGKYYLHNGRWHALHAEKPAPKGAPVAAHKHAAGQHAPAKHFSDDEWGKLKLPADNVNAGTFNKQLDALKQHSESGDVTAILGSQYGTNTYGKKLATIANHLLGLHGVEHKVAPGQKAGEHPAVQQAPDAAEKRNLGPVGQALKDAIGKKSPPDAHADWLEKMKGKKTIEVDGKPYYVLAEGTNWGNGTTHAHLASADEGEVQKNGWNPKQINTNVPTELLHPASGLAMPAFEEGKTKAGVKAYYDKVGQKVLDLAAAGDVEGLEKLKADGLKPNSKGKVGNTWAGKTQNSKLLLALHEQALAQLKGNTPADQPAPDVSAETVPAPAKAEASKPQAAQTPAAAKKGAAPKLTPKGLLMGEQGYAKTFANKTQAQKAAEKLTQQGYSATVVGLHPFYVQVTEPATNQNPIKEKTTGTKGDEAPSTPTSQITGEPVGQQSAKLSQIPWDSLLLPESNKNAKSHNGKVAQIKAMAEAGDIAGLEAFKAGTNTYGKKQNLLAQAALAALKESGVESAQGEAQPAPAQTEQDDGPKDGDTKQGADGILVFKNGRWHKVVAADEHGEVPSVLVPVDETPSASGLPEIPQFSAAGGSAQWAKNYQTVAKMLHDAASAEGAAGLKGKIINHSDGSFTVKVDGFKLKKISPTDTAEYRKQMHAYVEQLKASVGKPKKSPKGVSKAKVTGPSYAANGIQSMDNWKQTGPQGGSNPGGKFKDENGVEWYCKFPDNEDHAKSEVLAAHLYAIAGVAGQDAKLIMKDGKLGIASKWTTVNKTSPSNLMQTKGVLAGFGVDAWLANWDVVGLAYDNLQVNENGEAVRIDAGGSLAYRAQGEKKAFGPTVGELDSLRDPAINPQSAAVFGKMTEADIAASVAKVLKVSDVAIATLVNKFGPGSEADKQKLIETLIARKADLAAKFPNAQKKKVIVFDPAQISEPPDFMNWGGSGKSGPSSKEFLNSANHRAAQYIHKAAKTGDVKAVEAISAPIYDKSTGEITGKSPVLQHPSQHIKGYAQQVINEINYQLNPPKKFRFDGGHPLQALNASYPPLVGNLSTDKISKVGKFVALGDPGSLGLDVLGLPKKTYQSGSLTKQTYTAQAKQAIAKMPQTQQQAVKAYTGSSYSTINSSLWSGNPSGLAKSAAEALHTLAHDLEPGTVLSRKVNLHGAELQQVLASTGKVPQEPAIMSTSIRPSCWSGNVQMKLHIGPGVKGLWVGHGSMPSGGALSNHPGEDEIILPPNTRLLIINTKPGGGGDEDGFGIGSEHIIEAVVLPSEGY